MKPLRGRLLIKPIHDEDTYDGPLILPPKFKRPYPAAGYVKAMGDNIKEDISIGDVVIFPNLAVKAVDTEPYQPFADNMFIVHEESCLATLRDW